MQGNPTFSGGINRLYTVTLWQGISAARVNLILARSD
jgi:hypothetical protein